MPVCPNCGEENVDRAIYCMICATPLRAGPAPAKRRIVTIVFSDLVGSTSLGERLDAEALREVLDRYFTNVRGSIVRFGGTVEKYIGDAIMAVFGLGAVREDDALRAVLSAWDVHEGMPGLNDDLEARWGVRLTNRTGVFTGEVITGDPALGQRLVTGDAVNTAARLEQAAPPGEILIGELTHRIVARFVETERVHVEAKGKAEPVPAFRLLGVSAAVERVRASVSRLVGRAAELAAVGAAFEGASRSRRCDLAVVVGEPGAGKSRLAREFAEPLAGSATILLARCTPYDEGTPLRPLADAVRRAAGIEGGGSNAAARERLAAACEGMPNRDLAFERLGAALGLSSRPASIEEMLWAFAGFVQHIAAARPLILVLDDVQWADPALLDWIRRSVSMAVEGHALLLCLTRPGEQGEVAWFEEIPSANVIRLEPLPPSSVPELIEGVLGSSAYPEAIVDPVKRASAGNPLFVEQVLAMWRDEGLLARQDQTWVLTVDTPDVHVPPTINALLSERLDRLDENERSVVERASIVGETFEPRAVATLEPRGFGEEIGAVLGRLQAKDVVRPSEDLAWSFTHVLVRDAAYASILKRTRSELHGRLADWLDASAAGQPQSDGLIGYHFEQAFLLREELGPPDDQALAHGRRASDALGRQGRRSLASADPDGAARLFERAARTLPRDGEPRLRLLLDAAQAADEPRRQQALELAARTSSEGIDEPELAARLSILSVRSRLEAALDERYLAELEDACAILTALGDQEGVAFAKRVEERTRGWMGRGAESRRASEEGLEAAQRAARKDLESEFVASVAMCMVFDPTPADAALAFCETALEEHREDRILEMEILRPLSIFRAMRGDFEAARTILGRRRSLVEEFPSWSQEVTGWEAEALVEYLTGDLAREEKALRRAWESMVAMDDIARATSISARLAQAVITRGDLVEGLSWSEESERLATPHDYDAQTTWRRARARALARLGRGVEAEVLAGEAVAIVSRTDDIDLHAEALVDFAEVVEDRAQARQALVRAIDLFERKGNLASSGRARDRLAALPLSG